MNKVTTINLNGKAYQVEEAGFDKLKRYLDDSLEKLRDNPDKDEIRRDLEASIGDKCTHFLTLHKTVITSDEIDTILAEMGPVSTDEGSRTESEAKQTSTLGRKKLYNIRDGAMIAGVANGVAAYFDLDVTLVRILFVILALLTHGGFIALYILLMFFVPYAHTSKEKAHAHGQPFTAQELIDNAKSSYREMRQHAHHWKEDGKESKRTAKEARREEKRQWRQHAHHYHRTNFLSELLWTIFSIAVWILVITFGLWYGYHHVPIIHDFLVAVMSAVQQ